MIQIIFNVLSLYLWSILFHELGHYLYIRYVIKQKAEIYFTLKEFSLVNMTAWLGVRAKYDRFTNHQLYDVYGWGLFLGLLFLLIPILLYSVLYVVILPFYFYSCIPDIKNIWRLRYK